jgi:hypothetical protein
VNLSSSNTGSLDATPDCLCPIVPVHSPGTTCDHLPSFSLLPAGLDDTESPRPPPTHVSSFSSSQSPKTWTYHATTDDDRREALRLIADGVTQQRPFAVRCIVLHPAVLSIIVFVMTILLRYAYRRPRNVPVVIAVGAVCLAGALIAMHRATCGYLRLAETVGTLAWLKEGLFLRHHRGDGGTGGGGSKHHHHNSLPGEDEILLTKYGDEIVGVLVLRTARTNALTSGAPSANGVRVLRRRHSNSISSSSFSSGRLTGVIRAWTVKRPYRRRGIGRMLLESAVSVCRVRRLDGPIFAEEHNAHATRLLPWIFNKGFQKREEWARSLLRDVIEGERKIG